MTPAITRQNTITKTKKKNQRKVNQSRKNHNKNKKERILSATRDRLKNADKKNAKAI